MEPLTYIFTALRGDERLLQLRMQSLEHVVKFKGSRSGKHEVLSSELVTGIVSSVLCKGAEANPTQQALVQGASRWPAAETVLAAVQQRWEVLLLERLRAAQHFLPDVPLVAAPRSRQELENLRGTDLDAAWERIGSCDSPFTSSFQAPNVTKLLYDADDVLQALLHAVDVSCEAQTALSGTTCSENSSSSSSRQQQQQHHRVNLLQVVRAPTRFWLQSFFADIKPDRRQVGLDDVLHSVFREQQVQQAYRAASSCSAEACRAAARSGLPPSERPWVWACALGLHAAPPTPAAVAGWAAGPTAHAAASAMATAADEKGAWWRLPCPRDQQLLQLLCESCEQQVLLTDVLTCADVQRMADSNQYFVFEEAMRAVLLGFSRDTEACRDAAIIATPRLAAEDGKQLKPYPPSGVLPFQGLASFLGPLCFLYQQPAAVYRVFVAMYCKYWCCLHTLNLRPAPSPGLPVLCKTFLDLLQEVDGEVLQHLVRLSGPGSPLDLAFPWIMTAFSTHLSPAETLLLWDRIIGFDSLLPVAVLAVAVMSFRRDLVLAAQSSDELAEVLEDLSQLRVVPLLQAVLFDT